MLNLKPSLAPEHMEHEVPGLRRKIPEGDLGCSVNTSQERRVKVMDGVVARGGVHGKLRLDWGWRHGSQILHG